MTVTTQNSYIPKCLGKSMSGRVLEAKRSLFIKYICYDNYILQLHVMKLHFLTNITFDLVPVTLFLYYVHLVTRRKLLATSFFIPDPLTQKNKAVTQVF